MRGVRTHPRKRENRRRTFPGDARWPREGGEGAELAKSVRALGEGAAGGSRAGGLWARVRRHGRRLRRDLEQVLPDEVAELAGELHARGAAADDDAVEQALLLLRVLRLTAPWFKTFFATSLKLTSKLSKLSKFNINASLKYTPPACSSTIFIKSSNFSIC